MARQAADRADAAAAAATAGGDGVAAAVGKLPWQPADGDNCCCGGGSAAAADADADGGAGCCCCSAWPSERRGRDAAACRRLLRRWAALRCRLPIPCRACSRSNGGSCAGCSCPSGRSASGTWSTEMASRRNADACAPSSDACA